VNTVNFAGLVECFSRSRSDTESPDPAVEIGKSDHRYDIVTSSACRCLSLVEAIALGTTCSRHCRRRLLQYARVARAQRSRSKKGCRLSPKSTIPAGGIPWEHICICYATAWCHLIEISPTPNSLLDIGDIHETLGAISTLLEGSQAEYESCGKTEGQPKDKRDFDKRESFTGGEFVHVGTIALPDYRSRVFLGLQGLLLTRSEVRLNRG
jgi:hypothetical protein